MHSRRNTWVARIGEAPDVRITVDGLTVRVDVAVEKSSLNKGDITVQDIECVLASARVIPTSDRQKDK